MRGDARRTAGFSLRHLVPPPRARRCRRALDAAHTGRAAVAALAAAVLLGAAACRDDPTAPPGPPYIAIVTTVFTPPTLPVSGPFSYRVRELSGTLDIDRTVTGGPADTIVIPSLPVASYLVEVSGVPPQCSVRDGAAKLVVIPEGANTSAVRYVIECGTPLMIVTSTDGAAPDGQFVYEISGAGDGGEDAPRLGAIGASDTLLVGDLPDGDYQVRLRHIAPNCVVTSDGGTELDVTVAAAAQVVARFRIVCSEEAKRPRIITFRGSYADGAAAFVIRAVDPDGDMQRYRWTITDCRGRSRLPSYGDFGVLRPISGSPSVADRDTALIVGALAVGGDASALAEGPRCMAAWVADYFANTSPLVEVPLPAPAQARAPAATLFNARYVGTTAITTELAVHDPDGDHAGGFAYYIARDGTGGAFDGVDDLAPYPLAGFAGTTVPPFPVNVGFGTWQDYYGVALFLVDSEGNFTRVEDRNLFQ